MTTLDRLTGSWTFTMRHSAVAEPITGMQKFRWVLDGAFLQMDWHYEHPDFPDAIVMFDEHHQHYFDVRGIVRVFDLTLDDTGWSIIRRDEDFWQRADARFIDEDTIEGAGELSHDEGETWQHDYSIDYRRVR